MRRRDVLTLVLAASLTGSIGARPAGPALQSSAAVSPQSNTILVNVIVTDRDGRHVTDLTREAFAVRERDRPLDLTQFSPGGEPFSVGVLVDRSGSMQEGLPRVVQAIQRILQEGHADSEYFVAGIPERGDVLDWTKDRTAVRERVTAIARPDNVGGPTTLHNTLVLGLRKLQTGTHVRRALIVASDGMDTASKVPFQDVETALRRSSASFYALVPGNRRPVVNPFPVLTEAHAGRTIYLRDKDGPLSAGEQIANDLRHAYLIGFRAPTPIPDDKWHEISVSVTVPKSRLQVRTKKGYFYFK